jgi:hypothetical protein
MKPEECRVPKYRFIEKSAVNDGRAQSSGNWPEEDRVAVPAGINRNAPFSNGVTGTLWYRGFVAKTPSYLEEDARRLSKIVDSEFEIISWDIDRCGMCAHRMKNRITNSSTGNVSALDLPSVAELAFVDEPDSPSKSPYKGSRYGRYDSGSGGNGTIVIVEKFSDLNPEQRRHLVSGAILIVGIYVILAVTAYFLWK